jgi:hypothetical protein
VDEGEGNVPPNQYSLAKVWLAGIGDTPKLLRAMLLRWLPVHDFKSHWMRSLRSASYRVETKTKAHVFRFQSKPRGAPERDQTEYTKILKY